MPRLDYMFIAEHVRLESNGIINAVGVGITHVVVPQLPQPLGVSVAGRFWLGVDDEPAVPLRLRIRGADGSYEFDVVVGFEVLDLDAEIPFARLVEGHHVSGPTVEILRMMRPSMSAFHGRVVGYDRPQAQTHRGANHPSTAQLA